MAELAMASQKNARKICWVEGWEVTAWNRTVNILIIMAGKLVSTYRVIVRQYNSEYLPGNSRTV